MSIPFGGGMKFAVNDNIRIGLEVGFANYLQITWMMSVKHLLLSRISLQSAGQQLLTFLTAAMK